LATLEALPLKVVGLTGGIGSGKSVVAELFSELGVRLVDTDVISHALTGANGSAIGDIKLAFGEDFVDDRGALRRARMRAKVFADPTARRKLENILHPMILAESIRSLVDVRADSNYQFHYCLLAVPLLFERMSFRSLLWRSLVVDCPLRLQISRVQSRAGLAPAEIQRVIDAQLPGAIRAQLADDVISNAGDVATLKSAVTRQHGLYVAASLA